MTASVGVIVPRLIASCVCCGCMRLPLILIAPHVVVVCAIVIIGALPKVVNARFACLKNSQLDICNLLPLSKYTCLPDTSLYWNRTWLRSTKSKPVISRTPPFSQSLKLEFEIVNILSLEVLEQKNNAAFADILLKFKLIISRLWSLLFIQCRFGHLN